MNDGDNLRDLKAFIAVCEAGNFTRAAGRLGVSQPALSQTIRALEARLAVRLFSRTTRSVAPTEAGERLRGLVGPALLMIEDGLARLNESRERPAGRVRLTADEFAVEHVLLPALAHFLPLYPDIQVEVTIDHALSDIVSGRFDAGVRRGGLVAKDMIAVRIGPETRMFLIGAPDYLAEHASLGHPKDLAEHRCINLRLPTHGDIFSWTFRKGGREHRIRPQGPLVFNSLAPIRRAAIAGLGLAWLPEEMVRDDLASGHLVQRLEDWRHTFEGYCLYYPDRRHASPAFTVLVDALRKREGE